MKFWRYIFGLLLLIAFSLIIAVSQIPDGNLHIIACDVGEGDAILIIKGNTQILTDGGPNNKVLDCLGKYIPFWDRDLELVISTHPDADHSTGLVDVIQKYNVGKILMGNENSGTQISKALENAVGGMGVGTITPAADQSIGLGLIHLDILNSIGSKEGGDTNENSVVFLLNYAKFEALFTGDMPPNISDNLAASWHMGTVNYIKIPHHGSRNGITENLIKVIVPKMAIISVGKNPWGFPNQEVLDMLNKYQVNILRTDELGDIEVITDGESYWIE